MITCAQDLIPFLKRYHRTLLEGEPPRQMCLPDIHIPETLRALYQLFGHHVERPWGPLTSQDHLLKPSDLRIHGREVFFVNENQGCWSCAYDLDTPGNPVVRYDDRSQRRGIRQTDSLDGFLIAFALQEAVMSSPWLLAVQGVNSWQELKIDLVDLYRHGRFAYDGETHDFWMTADANILCMKTMDPVFWLASYQESVLDVRRPDLEYQIVSPRDPLAPTTYAGRYDVPNYQNDRSVIQRLLGWLSRR